MVWYCLITFEGFDCRARDKLTPTNIPFQGFLSTEDEVVRGNNGLKDQALAIKWVKDNIVAFGGDSSRITIAGQDTGAVSAHLHMFSPLSKGKK